MVVYKKSLFIFRRDLRLYDNTSLIQAIKNSEEVICCFILNPKQITKENKYYNSNSIEFLFESLIKLNKELNKHNSRLFLFYGDQIEILNKIVPKYDIESIFQNYDYTPFARFRDKNIKKLCEKLNINFSQYHDYLFNNPKKLLKDNGEPYRVFTPFYNKATIIEIQNPEEIKYENLSKMKIEEEYNHDFLDKLLPIKNKNLFCKGGRDNALKILNDLNKLEKYNKMRDYPELNATSKLSAHLKFGTISIRELYYIFQSNFGKDHPFLKQLYWREFWTYIAYFFPNVFKENFHQKYNKISWSNNEMNFRAWSEGNTGFPIVDAGMRQLNKTGYMHNRVRMIVASFLVKDLHIDWKFGEKYFAQNLIDYDPSLNNGNWQWASSTGCDGSPYFRIFNPWRQQEKFDKECNYIKKWLPELENLTPKEIHNWENIQLKKINYSKPIINHKIQAKISIEMFKNC